MQGLPYYLKFLHRFDNVNKLAKTSEDEILKLWQGLGYYSRARNMHHTAKIISEKYKGKFPETFEEIKSLKGVGDYTAAAITSFAFNKPHAVVDGNVYRFIGRLFGIKLSVQSAEGKTFYKKVLGEKIVEKKLVGNTKIKSPWTINKTTGVIQITKNNQETETKPSHLVKIFDGLVNPVINFDFSEWKQNIIKQIKTIDSNLHIREEKSEYYTKTNFKKKQMEHIFYISQKYINGFSDQINLDPNNLLWLADKRKTNYRDITKWHYLTTLKVTDIVLTH